MAHVFTVRELTQAVKHTLESEFPFVWVRGQVSNLSRPGSGHIYFTLKDQDACLSVVWFRSNHDNAGLVGGAAPAGLVDGQEVLCAGRFTVYPPRGSYQLVAELVQAEGVGRLHLEFELMKARLAERGYFDLDRKRPLPAHPCRLALVTALTGAAIRDFIRIAGERGYGCHIRVYPTLVQGEGAGRMIASAIELANTQGWAEAVALIRGGGSLEDLWAFNTEEVAEAVFRSRLPVIAGIGHEVDMSIADLVADVRAATPTHAAQILWPERRVLIQTVDALETSLGRGFEAILKVLESEVDGLERNLRHLSPAQRVDRWAERFDREDVNLKKAWNIFLDRKTTGLDKALDALIRSCGPNRLEGLAMETEHLSGRLRRAMETFMGEKSTGLDLASVRLAGLDPEAPLARGYGLIRVARTGRFLRDPAEVGPGERLDIRVQGGHVQANVASADPETRRGERS